MFVGTSKMLARAGENQNLGKKYLANEAKRENVSVTIKKSREQFVVIPKLGIFE